MWVELYQLQTLQLQLKQQVIQRKKVIFKIFSPFTDCIIEINNTQVDSTKDIDTVMSMYNSTEYSYKYLKTSGPLWQYFRDKPPFNNNNNNILDFTSANNNSKSHGYKEKITGQTDSDSIKIVDIMVTIKISKYFLELPLINFEINLILT